MNSTNLEKVSGALIEFDRVSAGIAALSEQYAGVIYDVQTPAGLADAKAARATIRAPRYEVERVRKDAKAPLLALGRELDAEAARITAALLKLEGPIDEQIKAEEARREAEKQAAIAAELARVTEIQSRIAVIRGWPTQYAGKPSALVAQQLATAEQYRVGTDLFEEFTDEAERARLASVVALRDLHTAALAAEEEARRIEAERAELERLRAEQAAREAEARAVREEEERQARANREREEREAAERRAAEEAELRRQREEIERERRAEAERIAAEDARIRAEREALAAERAAAEAAAVPEPVVEAVAEIRRRPTIREIIDLLARHYDAPPAEVISWLREAFGARAAA